MSTNVQRIRADLKNLENRKRAEVNRRLLQQRSVFQRAAKQINAANDVALRHREIPRIAKTAVSRG
jgi:hypothetical protein